MTVPFRWVCDLCAWVETQWTSADSLIQRTFIVSAQNLIQENCQWAQSLACNSHPSMLWPWRLIVLDFWQWVFLILLCTSGSPPTLSDLPCYLNLQPPPPPSPWCMNDPGVQDLNLRNAELKSQICLARNKKRNKHPPPLEQMAAQKREHTLLGNMSHSLASLLSLHRVTGFFLLCFLLVPIRHCA